MCRAWDRSCRELKVRQLSVDLGSRGAVVAALITGRTSRRKAGWIKDATWLASLAFETEAPYERLAELPHLRGQRSLAPNNAPRLIWFANPADPTSARKFRPDEIGVSFGPTARLTALVEITDKPILIDISKNLPWSPGMGKRVSRQRADVLCEMEQWHVTCCRRRVVTPDKFSSRRCGTFLSPDVAFAPSGLRMLGDFLHRMNFATISTCGE